MRVRAHVVPTHEGYLVNFTPTELGEYLLSIQFGGQPISSTPYRFTCTPGGDASAVRAWGPGLEGGVVCRPAEFVIDTREAGQGGLGVTVEGPCEAAINCRDNGDGTCAVAYLPTESGHYSINITFNERHIHGSPFHAYITHDQDLKQIRVSGNGIQPHGTCCASLMCDFLIVEPPATLMLPLLQCSECYWSLIMNLHVFFFFCLFDFIYIFFSWIKNLKFGNFLACVCLLRMVLFLF